MSFLCQYSDSEGEEDDKDKKVVVEKEEEEDEDGNDNKLSISKVNDQPYGLIITEETTEINKKDEDLGGSGSKDSKDSKDKDGEMSYQIADTENDKMNNCHTVIHTRLENREIEQEPKQVTEPDTPSSPVSPNLDFVSTPTYSKDPNFQNLYPSGINSTQTSPKQQQQQQTITTNTNTTADNILKSKKAQNIDTSFIPDAPTGEVDSALVEKIIKYHKMKQNGVSINQSLRASQTFKNPSILEKLIVFCEIDEIGSNYPISQFNPHKFQPNEYYEELNKKQREVDEKREFDRINSARTKIDFVSESKSKESNTTNNNTNTEDLKTKQQQPKKKYNKWEKEKYKQKQLQQQKSKATVISAAPTIIKKRENPTTNVSTSSANSTTTTTTANKSESLMKRFRTGGF